MSTRLILSKWLKARASGVWAWCSACIRPLLAVLGSSWKLNRKGLIGSLRPGLCKHRADCLVHWKCCLHKPQYSPQCPLTNRRPKPTEITHCKKRAGWARLSLLPLLTPAGNLLSDTWPQKMDILEEGDNGRQLNLPISPEGKVLPHPEF